MKKSMLIAFFLLTGPSLFAQMFPERRQVRQGNREYERENYVEAEGKYMGALSRNPASYEAHFNLGTAMYRQGRLEEAEQRFKQLGEFPYGAEEMAKTRYNQGNAQVMQYKQNYDRKKLQEAEQSYIQSLLINPNDQEAKFNLAYVQKLLEQPPGDGGGGGGDGGGGGGGDNEQNPDQNDQDPNGDPDQDQNGDPNSDRQNNDPQQSEGQQQPREGRMSREEAEQMLNALQNSEDNAREKADKQQGAAVPRSGKNW